MKPGAAKQLGHRARLKAAPGGHLWLAPARPSVGCYPRLLSQGQHNIPARGVRPTLSQQGIHP